MTPRDAEPRFRLYYWPLPFRGCFVSYLFAYRGESLEETWDFDTVREIYDRHPGEQPVPFMGPPMLEDRRTGRWLSQMPAIALYAAGELGLLPDEPFAAARGLKTLMDCNDVLMELCRYNGSSMWTREDWATFRGERLPNWLEIFEESLARGHFGREPATFADIAVFALFGTLTRCLPELETDVRAHAPGVHALCRRIGARASLAEKVAEHEQRYGNLYCGGQIEQSIRRMLAMDADGSAP